MLCENIGGYFRGKSYNTIISIIADDSLYFHGSCELTYKSLSEFIENNKEKLQKDDEEKGEIDIRNYFDDYYDNTREYYIFLLSELYGLHDFFKICYEHNLYIHSNF